MYYIVCISNNVRHATQLLSTLQQHNKQIRGNEVEGAVLLQEHSSGAHLL